MKFFRHFLMTLLSLGFLFACVQLPAQNVDKQIVEEAKRSTVHLITAEAERVRQFKLVDGSPFDVKRPDGGLGSGFFVDRDKIATNIHCVAGYTKIIAKLVGTETPYYIEGVIASDPENDLVILKVVGKGPKPLSLGDSDAVQNGEPIAAVGNPEGEIEGKITHGKVHNRRDSDKWLRLAVEVHPGNSGGPILSRNGVIGIAAQKASSTDDSFVFFGYAIPSNTLDELLKKNTTARPLDLETWQQIPPIRAYDDNSLAKKIFKKGKSDPEQRNYYYGAAIELLDRAIGRYNHSDFYLRRGYVYEELEQYQEAIDDYTESIDLKSDYASAYYSRGAARVIQGLYEKEYKGLCEEAKGLYEEAIDDFKEAIKLIPDNASPYRSMGSCKRLLERYEEAIADFGKAIELSPDNAYYNRGTAMGAWGECEEALGKIEAAKSQYLAAIRNFKKILELDPNHADAIDNLRFYKKRIDDIDD